MLASPVAAYDVKCTPPHDIPNQPVFGHLPQGPGAERVLKIMERGAEVLADHPVNQARRAAGRDPVSDIWLWGQGRPRRFEPFAERFGQRAAVITAVDIIRGLAISMGMELIDVPGATGYFDTDYAGKGRAAVRALDDFDLIAVHVEATDEAGHAGNVTEKVKALAASTNTSSRHCWRSCASLPSGGSWSSRTTTRRARPLPMTPRPRRSPWPATASRLQTRPSSPRRRPPSPESWLTPATR